MTTASTTITLREFWDENVDRISRVFVVSTAQPAGITYRQKLDGDIDSEDYCDLAELIDSGLSFGDIWNRRGIVTEGVWRWNGSGGSIRDHRWNSYLKIEVK